jgi:hypothetical protein
MSSKRWPYESHHLQVFSRQQVMLIEQVQVQFVEAAELT